MLNKRQLAKEKAKIFRDLYFYVVWLDDLRYNCLPCKDVVLPDGSPHEITELDIGCKTRAQYSGALYDIEILGRGTFREMQQMARENDQTDSCTAPELKEKPGSQATSEPIVSNQPVLPIEPNLVDTEHFMDAESVVNTEPLMEPIVDTELILNSAKPSEKKAVPKQQKKKLTPKNTPKKMRKPKSADAERQLFPPKRVRSHVISSSDEDETSDGGNRMFLSKSKKKKLNPENENSRQWQNSNIVPYLKPQVPLSSEVVCGGMDIKILTERLKTLEKTTKKLQHKVKENEREITQIKSSSFSSSSELRTSFSPGMSPFSPTPCSSVSVKREDIGSSIVPMKRENSSLSQPIAIEDDDELICGVSVNRVQLAHSKLQSNPSKAALKLLSCLFTNKELVNGNPNGTTTSKDKQRVESIKKLDPARMQYIESYLETKWPGCTGSALRRKITQKCTDMYSNHLYTDLRD